VLTAPADMLPLDIIGPKMIGNRIHRHGPRKL
jgi:hypothetical protein